MKNNLKYLVPAAAVTTLFLVGCGDDDVVEAAAQITLVRAQRVTKHFLEVAGSLLKKMVALSQTHFSQMRTEINMPIR